MDREQFVEMVKECREMINSGKYNKCPCPEIKCEWHGNCFECVLLHSVNQDHVPRCMQPMLHKKLRELAKVAEMTTSVQPSSPKEYWDYVNEVIPKEKKK